MPSHLVMRGARGVVICNIIFSVIITLLSDISLKSIVNGGNNEPSGTGFSHSSKESGVICNFFTSLEFT
jgi:hypothetical protein